MKPIIKRSVEKGKMRINICIYGGDKVKTDSLVSSFRKAIISENRESIMRNPEDDIGYEIIALYRE